MSQSKSIGSNYTRKVYFDPKADQSSTGGYWITDEELRQILSNLIDTDEVIQNASVYSNPLSKWQWTNDKLHHAFVVIQTMNWWWSMEKNMEGITIQRSRDIESVRDMYQRKKRTTGLSPWTRIRKNKTTQDSNTTIMELINYIWRKDCLNDIYHILDDNCQKFAATVFNRIESPCDEQVYFDEAADQPRSSAHTCRMNVDTFFCKVQRLSASETFSKVELYTAERLKSVPLATIAMCVYGVYCLPYFLFLAKKIMFHTEISFQTFFCFLFCLVVSMMGFFAMLLYSWSFERFPEHYVVHRASNKDILLKECKRASQHFWIFKPKLHSEALAVERGTVAILEFIWKKDNLTYKDSLPIEECGHIAPIIYENFKRPNF